MSERLLPGLKQIEQFRTRLKLRGEAARIIKDLPISDDNLVVASDYDGTVAGHGAIIPSEVRRGVKRAGRAGIQHTVITGRLFQQFPQEAKNDLISPPDTPLVTEGGAFITRKDTLGKEVKEVPVVYTPLTERDIEDTLALAKDPETGFILYPPYALSEKPILWVPRPPSNDQVASMIERFTLFSEVFTPEMMPYEELVQKAKQDEPCMVAVIANDAKKLSSRLPASMSAALNSGRIFTMTHKGIDKNSSLGMLSAELGIPLESFIAAGNDINDYPMLLNPNLVRAVFVGDANELRELYIKNHLNPEKILEVRSPEELGILLEELGKLYHRRRRYVDIQKLGAKITPNTRAIRGVNTQYPKTLAEQTMHMGSDVFMETIRRQLAK